MKSTIIVSVLFVSILTACGGGSNSNGSNGISQSPTTFTISGTVSGLNGSLAIQDNGANTLGISSNGPFTIFPAVPANGSYTVTVSAQPSGQICTVSNGSGSGVSTNVTNVNIACSTDTYSVGGTVTGLSSGQQVQLLNNGTNAQIVTSNSGFSFTTPTAYNGSYAVTIGAQPSAQTCTVSNGSGSGVVANISNISVVCANNSTNTFSVSGTVSGITNSGQVTILDNNSDALNLQNGPFTFPTPIAQNGSYAVTVGVNSQPAGQTCSVSNGSGLNVTANISNVSVVCATTASSTYTVSGTVSGLTSGQQVTLLDNGVDALTINSNSTFTFATPIAQNGSYVTTVGTQPIGESCTVSNGSGSGVNANISNVSIVCTSTSTSATYFDYNYLQNLTGVTTGAYAATYVDFGINNAGTLSFGAAPTVISMTPQSDGSINYASPVTASSAIETGSISDTNLPAAAMICQNVSGTGTSPNGKSTDVLITTQATPITTAANLANQTFNFYREDCFQGGTNPATTGQSLMVDGNGNVTLTAGNAPPSIAAATFTSSLNGQPIYNASKGAYTVFYGYVFLRLNLSAGYIIVEHDAGSVSGLSKGVISVWSQQ